MSYTYDPLSATVFSVATGTAGAAGTYLTATNTGLNWANLSTVNGSTDLTGQSLEVNGDANFTGEVTIKGKKLSEVLANIESRLAILHPNEKLEEKWENLRGLREAYVALEKEILEKEAMWSILKR